VAQTDLTDQDYM